MIGELTDRIINIPITPRITDGQVRVVLSWPEGPEYLDLYTLFKVDQTIRCELFFGKRKCVGTHLNIDKTLNTAHGIQTITINNLGKYVYSFFVNKFIDISGGKGKGDDPIYIPSNEKIPVPKFNITEVDSNPLKSSRARISIFANGYEGSIKTIGIAMDEAGLAVDTVHNIDPNHWWLAFCLDGKRGVDSIISVNNLATRKPDYTMCENLFTPNPLA